MIGRKYRFSVGNVLDRWAKRDGGWRWRSVKRWLYSLQRRGERCHRLFLFCEWAGKTPDELLAMKNGECLEVEYLLDEFVSLDGDGEAPYPNSVMWNCVQAVRSFFKANYKVLQPCAGRMFLRKVKPYRKHTKDQVRAIYNACMNPRDRSMVNMAFCSALAKETLTKLKWLHLEDGWENQEIPHVAVPDKLLKGHGIGKWRGVEQHTFLTFRAKQDLVEYRDWMERERGVKFTVDSFVYRSLHPPYGKITYHTMGEIPALISLRTSRLDEPFAFSWHDGRRYVQTALEEAGWPRNWIQKVKGRKVRGEDNPYSRPEIEKLREAYEHALPRLCFLDVEALASRVEMDKVKLVLGERTLREQELARRVENLEEIVKLLQKPKVVESVRKERKGN